MDNEILFLATTAIEDFWDKNSKILFLGEWCLLYNRRNIWQQLDYSVYEYPWDKRHSIGTAYALCQSLYENTISFLRNFMNETYGENHSIRYWKIILGSWLITHIHWLYDKYICINLASNYYKHLKTFGLAYESFITPFDYKGFIELSTGDFYNLQFFTMACDFIGVKCEVYKSVTTELQKKVNPNSNTAKKSMRDVYLKTSLSIFKLLAKYVPVWSVSYYSSKKLELSLSAAMFGKYMPFNFGFLDKSLENLKTKITIDRTLRNSMILKGKEYFSSGGFEEFLMESLRYGMPLLYLECYPFIKKILKQYTEKTPRILISDIGFRASRSFPFIAANVSEMGGLLVTTQHGGSFGTVPLQPMEYIDQDISDEYWTWGWKNGVLKECRPVPGYVLERLKKAQPATVLKCGYTTKILYLANYFCRYLSCFWNNPLGGPQAINYIEWQQRFLEHLPALVKEKTLVRLYPIKYNTYGLYQKERLIDRCYGIRFDNYTIPFEVQLNRHDILVVDSNFTTVLQALAINKPTIIFWNPNLNELKQPALDLYNDLKNVGILYHSPEEAADKVANIADEPYSWWNQENIQIARAEFCKHFAYMTDN